MRHVPVRVPGIGQIDLFKIYLYSSEKRPSYETTIK